jgi:endonuclease G
VGVYHRFSLVVYRKRRFAIYSAANVDFSGRFELKRPKDLWRVDPRIDAAVQVTGAFHTGNQFDRGHLTRREDTVPAYLATDNAGSEPVDQPGIRE